jgi:hypothetical protein
MATGTFSVQERWKHKQSFLLLKLVRTGYATTIPNLWMSDASKGPSITDQWPLNRCDLIRVCFSFWMEGRSERSSIWSKIEESGQSRKNHDLNSSKKSKASALRLLRLRKVFLEGNHSWRKNLVMNSKARELRMPWLGRLGQQEMGRSPGNSQTGDRKPMKTRSGFCLWIMSTWNCDTTPGWQAPLEPFRRGSAQELYSSRRFSTGNSSR